MNLLGFVWVLPANWDRHIGELKAFHREHGHCDVPMRYRPNRRLGRWVSYLRQRRKLGTLAKEQLRLLKALGFSWKLREHCAAVPWEIRFKELKRFKKAHGHCNVPGGYKPDPSLGNWVARIRQLKKRGVLAKEQVRLLDALGLARARHMKPQPKKRS